MSWIIRLQGLPLTANAADIRGFFAGLRIPDGSVHIVGGPDGDAFIGFATDEDARQAMSFDGGRIHDQRVRLFLSSRMEMDAVIAKARIGALGTSANATPPAPKKEDPQNRRTQPMLVDSYGAQRGGQQQTSQDLYGLRNGAHHSTGSTETSRQADYGHQELGRESAWGRNDSSDSWKGSSTQSAFDTRSSVRPANAIQDSVAPWQDPKMISALSQGGTNQSSSTMPVYQQSAREDRFNQYDQDASFQGYNASVQPPVASASNSYSQIPQGGTEDVSGRYTTAGQSVSKVDPTPTPIFQQGAIVPPIIPGQPLQMPPAIPGLIMPPVLPGQLPAAGTAAVSAAPNPMIPVNPFASQFPAQSAPIFPAIPVRRTYAEKKDSFCVELSRLPSDLVRPAALEQFLRPTIPLTLSSVKVVYDPKGFVLHSLVRFECAKDAENTLARDGEQGIRIRACTLEAFEEAVDGSQIPPPSYRGPSRQTERDRDRGRDMSRSSRSGSSSRRHHSPERRESSSRRDDRGGRGSRDREDRMLHRSSRRRSRTPPRDYRDIKRRRDERVCIEITNLPFRVSESEIRNYFGPGCEPTKVTRAFYEDGRASDRWIAEFRDFEISEKAYRTRGKIQDRVLRMRRLTNEEADTLLAIPDKFGMQRKEEYERKHGSGDVPPEKVGSQYDSYGGYQSKQDSSAAFNGGFRGSGRGRGPARGGYHGGPDRERSSGAGNPPSAGGPNFFPSQSTHGGPSNVGGPPQRMPPPRPSRGNGPLLQSAPRPPLISPPTFFAATPSSNIRQRGPPPQSSGHGSPHNGPRVPFSSGNGPSGPHNGPAGSHRGPQSSESNPRGPKTSGRGSSSSSAYNDHPTNIPAAAASPTKTCIVLANVPTSVTDPDLARFLSISSSRINENSVRRTLDGTVYLDLGNAEDAAKAVTRCNRQTLGDSIILVTAISRENMIESLEKKVAYCEQDIDPSLIAAVGEPGTVISCHGFPANVTLRDVSQFFDKYSLKESSVRIKLDDNGVPTGECLLSVGSPQEAQKAVMLLSGRRLKGSTVTMTVVQPPPT